MRSCPQTLHFYLERLATPRLELYSVHTLSTPMQYALNCLHPLHGWQNEVQLVGIAAISGVPFEMSYYFKSLDSDERDEAKLSNDSFKSDMTSWRATNFSRAIMSRLSNACFDTIKP